MELRDRKVLVVGVGKTGMETVKFLLGKGARVSVSDNSPAGEIAEQVKTLKDWGVSYETGGHSSAMFLSADTIVLSPGVPFGIPPVREALARGIEVISEVELASRFIRKPTIAVTGSNGKTTTSTLIARILEKNGRRVFLGANIGTPLIQIADDCGRYDVLVLELSSFQLQGIESFRPEVSVILNVTPNHLDHHASFEEYAESKMKIFSNQTAEDWCIYKSDDTVIVGYVPEIKAVKIPFGVREGEGGVSYDGRGIKYGTGPPQRRERHGGSSGFDRHGMRPASHPRGRARVRTSPAQDRIRGRNKRREILQRFQIHEPRRHAPRSREPAPAHNPHSRRQGQGRELRAPERDD